MAAHWVQLADEGAGSGAYYYNQITGRTQWVEPVKPEKARHLILAVREPTTKRTGQAAE